MRFTVGSLCAQRIILQPIGRSYGLFGKLYIMKIGGNKYGHSNL